MSSGEVVMAPVVTTSPRHEYENRLLRAVTPNGCDRLFAMGQFKQEFSAHLA